MYLDEILQHKREEVAAAKLSLPLAAVVGQCHEMNAARPFLSRLRAVNGRVGLIAEVEKASPSAGIIKHDFHPIEIASEYGRAGADCLSVLTDERFFQGRLSYLAQIKSHVDLPLLRKDFIIDPYQVYESKAAGADAILLIAAALDPSTLAELYALARVLGMDVLVEVHTEEEMTAASHIGADLVGINSRDLTRFVTDLGIIEKVARSAPANALLVGESGIKTRDDVLRLEQAGVHAILVGETLMRAPSISAAIFNLLH